MNFANYSSPSCEAARTAFLHAALFISGVVLVWLAGCGDRVRTPSPEQLAAFEEAGSAQPVVDMESIQRARLYTGAYRVVPGDVLEFTMPTLLRAVSAAEVKAAQMQTRDDPPYICRVSPQGTITLPAVGEMRVTGKSLAEIEENVINAYRRYVVLHPSVFVRVSEYKTCRVAISGAVTKPGVYALRGDQMFLGALLMEAEGIIKEGAATIRIGRLDQTRMRPSRQASLLPLAATGAHEARQDVQMAESGQDMMGAPASRPTAKREVTVIFQREGALNTTGWLALRRADEILVHRWLDLGNEPQRQAFLRSVGATSRQIVLDDLQAKLSQLAGHLESRWDNPRTGLTASIPGWEAIHADLFMAHIREAATDTTTDSWSMAAGGGTTSRAGTLVAGTIGIGTTVAGVSDAMSGDTTTLVLPVKGWNIPFRDVALQEGDTVVVEQMEVPLFCVLGLVARPGNFDYPPMAQYTVAQAIGFAGGLDAVADPRYVTIYRLTQDGSIVRVPLRLIEHGEFTQALGTRIRPGDVIAVEHTPRTRMNTVVNNLLRVNTGVYLTGNDLWGSN